MDKKIIRKKLNTPELENIILNYVKALQKDGRFNIQEAILFGSYAKGGAKIDSDIDLCVISPDFGKDDIEEGQYLFKKTIGVDSRIEPVGYSPVAYQKEESPLIYEIKKYGKSLKFKN